MKASISCRHFLQIGNELQKLNKKINGIAMTEKPQRSRDGVKSKSRKEKNKFASRACRLKKKAQHEANKLKLFGLEQEHCKTSTSGIQANLSHKATPRGDQIVVKGGLMRQVWLNLNALYGTLKVGVIYNVT